MREYVIKGLGPSGGGGGSSVEELTPKTPPVTARPVNQETAEHRPEPPEPADPAPARPVSAKPPPRRGERSFIVSYEGVFVGFFEAEEAVTPREAYLRVAQELCSQSEDEFDPEKLELYKPVLLRSARPLKRCKVVRGRFASLPGRLDETGRHDPAGNANVAPGTNGRAVLPDRHCPGIEQGSGWLWSTAVPR